MIALKWKCKRVQIGSQRTFLVKLQVKKIFLDCKSRSTLSHVANSEVKETGWDSDGNTVQGVSYPDGETGEKKDKGYKKGEFYFKTSFLMQFVRKILQSWVSK